MFCREEKARNKKKWKFLVVVDESETEEVAKLESVKWREENQKRKKKRKEER